MNVQNLPLRVLARRTPLRSAIAVSAIALGLGGALAQVAFDAPDANYSGRVRISGAQPGTPVYAGAGVTVSGQNFKPGQEVVLARGITPLSAQAFVADQEGKFSGSFDLPADAVAGVHPLVVSTANPYNAEIVEVKISPKVPLSGAEKFEATTAKLVPGLYQSAYSATNKMLFVTAAVGRPPVKQSELLKVDPQTLEISARATPPEAPGRDGGEGGVFAVYGVGVDDVNDTVWATNTRQDTVAVYKQSDLSLLKQFDAGTVPHARDVVIDKSGIHAFAGATGSNVVAKFDAKSLTLLQNIEIKSTVRGKDFSVGSLYLDSAGGKLYTVSLTTSEAAIINAETGAVEKVFPVEGARTAIGVSYDSQTNRIFVAGQGSDNLLIVDAESGKTLHNVPVGAGALNVVFDPKVRLAYATSRDAGTVTVVDPDGNVVANLENSPLANHVSDDGQGNVFAVNKSRDAEDPQGDRITRISPKS